MVTEISGVAVDPSMGGNGLPLSHALPSLENGWSLRPFQIVSLLDMDRFFAGDYWKAFDGLREQLKAVTKIYMTRGNSSTLRHAEPRELIAALSAFEAQCKESGLVRPLERLEKFRVLQDDPQSLEMETIKWELKELIDAAMLEADKRKFLVLKEDTAWMFNLMRPFGEKVYNSFECARKDIREAHDCYVLDRPTAAVFHLTRVLERGLFVLVQDPRMGITLRDAREETWETLINKVESFIKAVQEGKRSIQKGIDLELFSGSAMQFRYFKDHWRNPISHARSSYDGPQALSSIQKVKDFISYLAENGFKQQPGMILP